MSIARANNSTPLLLRILYCMIFVVDADTQNMQIKAPKGTVNVYIFRTINTTKRAGYALCTRISGAHAGSSRNEKFS
jgi:hypothetical protein